MKWSFLPGIITHPPPTRCCPCWRIIAGRLLSRRLRLRCFRLFSLRRWRRSSHCYPRRRSRPRLRRILTKPGQRGAPRAWSSHPGAQIQQIPPRRRSGVAQARCKRPLGALRLWHLPPTEVPQCRLSVRTTTASMALLLSNVHRKLGHISNHRRIINNNSR